MRRWAGGCVAVVAAIAIVGCGGGDSSTSSSATTTSVSKDQYVASVKSRCAAYQQEREAAQKPLQDLFRTVKDPSQLDPQQLQSVADQISNLDDATRHVIDDLEALPRPAADADRLATAFAKFDTAKDALDAADQAAAQGDGAALAQAYQDLDAALNGDRELSKEFGFDACG